jgi:hypothetical protein
MMGAVTKKNTEHWTRRRAFAQVRHRSNIQLLPYSLVCAEFWTGCQGPRRRLHHLGRCSALYATVIGASLNPADLLSSSSRPLPGEQHRVWAQAVRDLGLDLDLYTCKASYVCGMLRQFMEAAGLQMSHAYHLEALVSAASAAELLGWCSTGATNTDHAGKRLRAGVLLLEQVGPAFRGSDQRSEADLVARVFSLRNFGAHGAAHGQQLVLDQALTMWLLRSLSRALDEFWAVIGDLRRHQRFAQAAITPGSRHSAGLAGW